MNDLVAEVSAELAADIAKRKAELLRLERQAELKEATEPSDWHERPRTYAKLDCGCQWQCSRYAYGFAVAPRWTVECDRHAGLDAHMEANDAC